MALKDWKLVQNNMYAMIYQNRKDSSLTFEIHKFDARDMDEGDSYKYYVFPAMNGKGIPNSPDVAETKKEAMDLAKKYMDVN
jgi:hypothetical protein